MRTLRQFGVLVLLLVSCLAPAMDCVIPNAQMNAEERACCRAMTNQCGQTEMPASHGCCQKTPGIHDNALDTKTVTVHQVVVPLIWLGTSGLMDSTSAAAGPVERLDYSPPNSPPSTVSILRI